MNFFDITFWIASAVIFLCILGLIFAKRVRATFIFGLAVLFSVSSLYFLLGSAYLAFLHIFFSVYLTGLALYLSARINGELDLTSDLKGSWTGIIISSVFAALLSSVLISSKWIEFPPEKELLPALEITRLLQSEYILPLFLFSLIVFAFIAGILTAGKNQTGVKG